jgi:hypothetical protein
VNYLYFTIFIAIGCLIGFAFARFNPVSFQNDGEARVSKALRSKFLAPDFHLLNHVTLNLKNGTTQIDHILVSRYGVFVIETKGYSGWIFANANHSNWTQVLFGKKFKFQNPINQNAVHVQAVAALLDFLPSTCIKSAVVFAGSAEFKTEMPNGVFTISNFVHFLTNHTEPVMSINRVQFCVGRLETARLSISGQTDLEHVQNLHRRYGKLK